MKRIVWMIAFAASVVACNKPSEEECKGAIENMRKLLGTDSQTTDIQPHIRRCRGGSTKESVQCASKATSRAELEACKFAHFDEAPAPGAAGSGSAK